MYTRVGVAAGIMVAEFMAAAGGTLPSATAAPGFDQDFAISSEVPTLAELDAQIRLLVATIGRRCGATRR